MWLWNLPVLCFVILNLASVTVLVASYCALGKGGIREFFLFVAERKRSSCEIEQPCLQEVAIYLRVSLLRRWGVGHAN